MAKYLKPRRGAQAIAHAQNIVLQKGELFMEFPEDNIGREAGRIVVGDGSSSYSEINYAPGSTTDFQPFITDPSIYVPMFEDSIPASTATAVHDYNAATEAINEIGDGSTASITKLPKAIGAIKKALVSHNDSLAYLTKNGIQVNATTESKSGGNQTYFDNNIVLHSLINRKSSNYYSVSSNSTYSGDKLYIESNYGKSSSNVYYNSTASNLNDSTVSKIYINSTTTGSRHGLINSYSQIDPYKIKLNYSTSSNSDGTNSSTQSMEYNFNDIIKQKNYPNNSTTYGWNGSSISSLEEYLGSFDNKYISANGGTISGGDLTLTENKDLILLNEYYDSSNSTTEVYRTKMSRDYLSTLHESVRTFGGSTSVFGSTGSFINNDSIAVETTRNSFVDKGAYLYPDRLRFLNDSKEYGTTFTYNSDTHRDEFDIYNDQGWGGTSIKSLNELLTKIVNKIGGVN